MSSEKRAISVLLGPVLFLGIVVLLLLKISHDSWFWLFGVVVATGVASWVAYLSFLEIVGQKKELRKTIEKRGKETEDLRAILDETHLFYRDKVSKLETALTEYERNLADKVLEKEGAVAQLSESVNHYKSLARSFEISLEEALNELRTLSQLHYMQSQEEAPKNLVKQHQQLRQQFEEKSLVLDQTRRRLFEAEGFLISLKKDRGLELLAQNEEMEAAFAMVGELLQENEALEAEVKALENLVIHKSPPQKKTGKKLQEMLEFQFEATTSSKE